MDNYQWITLLGRLTWKHNTFHFIFIFYDFRAETQVSFGFADLTLQTETSDRILSVSDLFN